MSSEFRPNYSQEMLYGLDMQERRDFRAIAKGWIYMIRRRDRLGAKDIADGLELPEHFVANIVNTFAKTDPTLRLRSPRRTFEQMRSDRVRILVFMTENPYLSLTEASKKLGMDPYLFKNDIWALRKDGILVRTKYGYSIPD